MNRLRQACVWLSRIRRCCGFGIHSPSDYRFVRYVINERWPYYAYSEMPHESDWLTYKLGRLYFRIANYRQPLEIFDKVGVTHYLQAGCRKAHIVDNPATIQLAVLPIKCDFNTVFEHCDGESIVIFQDIYKNKPLWHTIEYDRRVRVTFDLYYCGIVIFDPKRSRQNYVVNF